MSYHCYSTKQITVLLMVILHIAPPTAAFGYAKCILTYENTRYANCIEKGIVNLGEAVRYLPGTTLWLNVSHNDIVIVKDGAFSHMPNLIELKLSGNKICTIQSGAFYNLSNLQILDLGHNSIQSLDKLDMNNLTNLRTLSIASNKLSTIQSMTLNHLNALQELDLSLNHISHFRLVAEAIQDLGELSKLNLSYNFISELQNKQGLMVFPSLNCLDLSYNSISILDFSNLYMANLTNLRVMNNNMAAVNVSSFSYVPNLEQITFDENPLNISFILGIKLPKLTELHWSSMKPALNDQLSTACQVFQTLPNLQMLDIKHSKVANSKLQEIGKCTNLTQLILSTTSIGKLNNMDLQSFKYLEILYLDKCKISAIHGTAWAGLEALHTLILERNRLSNLENHLFSPLISLRYLDLSKNYLTHINPNAFTGLRKLSHLILRSCTIVAIVESTFINLRNLRFLDLQGNSISLVKSSSFHKLTKLETLLLSENKINAIQTYGLKGLISLKRLSVAANNIYKISNNTFKWLRTLTNLNISRNQLSFNEDDSRSPFKMLALLETLDISYQTYRYKDKVSQTLFQGLQSLKKLYIQGISSFFFKNVSFSFLTNLTELDMSETNQGSDLISTVELITKCNQVRHLALDNNGIRDLPENIFDHFTSLEYLSMKQNKLRNISKNLLKPLSNLRYFDVYMNPLSCYCENYWFQNWSVFNTQVQVPFLQSYSCFDRAAQDINFVSQDLSYCGTDISVFFFIGTFVLTLLFLVGSLVMVKLKWSILYFYYMLRVWFQWKLQKEDRIYKYDAYISYCSDDEDWVIKELLLHLEGQGQRKFKLCFKPRDFMPGHYHIDNIQDAINNSRKTLCVVSRNYLESQWCRIEIEMACSRVFYQREDVLLVVFLEEIPDFRLSAYHKLRKLIKQNTYINWPEDPRGDEFFWFKLRKALDVDIYEEEKLQLSVTK
ncbi:toll-like receptor 13 [Pseudophryne corroboree]|uniref:toll-like receptor 13 n=1 Tax=Pseudophryne corroboree TaxID=495146 RepID=UPI003081876D